MRIAIHPLSMLLCAVFLGCATTNHKIPITLLQPEVNGLTVSVNGVTIQDPDGPFRWDWGDGTIETNWFPNKHTYRAPGFYHISVEVIRDGKSNTQDLYLKLAG